MKLIPEEWSIGVISQFLSGSVRLSLHKSRNTKILRSLARGENLKASLRRTSAHIHFHFQTKLLRAIYDWVS